MDIEIILIFAAGLISIIAAVVTKINSDKREAQLTQSQNKLQAAQEELGKAQKDMITLYKRNEEKTDTIIELQNALGKKSELTINLQQQVIESQKENLRYSIGYDSYCNFLIQGGDKNSIFGVLDHVGNYPIYDLELSILEVDEFNKLVNKNVLPTYKKISIGTLAVGDFRSLTIERPFGIEAWNFFYTSRSGKFSQEFLFRYINKPGEADTTVAYITAIKNSKFETLYRYVSEDFLKPGEIADSFLNGPPFGATRMRRGK